MKAGNALSFETVAVCVDGPAPLGHLEVPLRRGLNALYGRNGAGKTRLLRGIEEVMSGARTGGQVVVQPLDEAAVAESVMAEYQRWLGDDERPDLEARLGRFPWRSGDRSDLDRVLGEVLIGSWAYSAAWPSLGPTGQDRPSPVDVVEEIIRSRSWVLRSNAARDWRLDLAIRFSEETPLLAGLRQRVVDSWHNAFDAVPDHYPGGDQQEEEWLELVAEAFERFGQPLCRRDFFTVLGPLPEPRDPDECWSAIDTLKTPGALVYIDTVCPIVASGALSELRKDDNLISFSELPAKTIRAIRDFGCSDRVPAHILDRLSEDEKAMREYGEGTPMIDVGASGPTIAPWVATPIEELTSSVNSLLTAMLPEPPTLTCTVADPERWADGDACRWSATDLTGANVGLAELSGAQTRLVRLAVTLALDSFQDQFREVGWRDRICTPSLVLLDEPEAGLHRLAEDRLTQALHDYGRQNDVAIVAATHSSSFLRNPDVALVEVFRRAGGRSSARPVEFPEQAGVDALGITRADLLQLYQLILLVEGHHDQIVLNEIAGRELARRRTLTVPLRGTFNLNAIVDLEILAHTLELPVLALLDNARSEAIDHLWNMLQNVDPDADSRAFQRVVEDCLGPQNDQTDEEKQISALAKNLLATRQLARFAVYGLSRGDIIEYLPVERLVPNATSWEELREEHLHALTSRRNKPAKDFKKWLTITREADFGDDALRIAAGIAAQDPPEELLLLLARIDSIVDGWAR